MIKIKNDVLTVESLLASRGMNEEWFMANESNFHDTFEMRNADKAVAFIGSNINKKWTIIIDSDMDGICSSAIAYAGLQELGVDVTLTKFQGKTHGIDGRVAELLDAGYEVVLIPDGGTNDIDACRELSEAGVEILILDHHQISEDNPYKQEDNPFALIVNPALPLDTSPNKSLCGTTVTWKIFSEAVEMSHFLDLCALATVADRMSLTPLENMGFVNVGLAQKLNPFLQLQIEKDERLAGKPLSPRSLGWYIAPVFNAAVRMGEPEDIIAIVKALATHQADEELLEKMLKLRRQQNTKVTSALPSIVYSIDDTSNLIVANRPPSLPKALTGLVANRLAQMYRKPVLIGSLEDGVRAGSGRNTSNMDFELRQTLLDSGLMIFAEGHGNAHGFAIKEENVPAVKEYFNQAVDVDNTTVVVDGLLNSTPSYEIENLLSEVQKITEFLVCDKESIQLGLVVDKELARAMPLSEGKHWKSSWNGMDVIQWNNDRLPTVGEILVVEAKVNTWNGSNSLQLIVGERVSI